MVSESSSQFLDPLEYILCELERFAFRLNDNLWNLSAFITRNTDRSIYSAELHNMSDSLDEPADRDRSIGNKLE